MKRLSLTLKFILVVGAVYSIAGFAVSVFNSQARRELLKQEKITLLEQQINGTLKTINEYVQKQREQVRSITAEPEIRRYFHAQQSTEGIDTETGLSIDQINKLIRLKMAAFFKENKQLVEVSLYDSLGKNIFTGSAGENGIFKYIEKTEKNVLNEVFFTQAVAGPEGSTYLILPRLLSTTGVSFPVLDLSAPVYDENGFVRGVVFMEINTEKITEELQLINKNLGGGAYSVTDNAGFFLYSSKPEIAWSGPDNLNSGANLTNYLKDQQDLLENTSIEPSVLEIGGTYYFVFPLDLDPLSISTELRFILEVPESLFVEDFKVLPPEIILFQVLMFLIMIIVTVIYLRFSLINPVSDLINVAHKIAEGDLNSRVKFTRRDELGVLAEMFNSMADKIKESNTKLESMVEAKTKELQAKLAELESSNENLEQTKRAILNVMEDLEAAKQNTEQERIKMESFLQSIADGVIVVDEHGVIISINNAATQMLSIRKEDALGKNAAEIISAIGKDKKGNLQKLPELPLAASLKSGKEMKTEYYLLGKEARRVPVSSNVAPVLVNNKVIGAVEVIRDITKEKEIDLAKSEFVSMVSHQLRTPITTLNWYTEMILEDPENKLDPEKKTYIEEIRDASQRMLDLVNALLDVSRIDLGTLPVNPEPLNVVDVVKSVVQELRPAIERKKLNFREGYGENIPQISADKKIARMIVTNLLTNSVKYTPDGGDVSVDVYMQEDQEHGKELVIKVSDSGIGIPKEQYDKVFEKMFRADNVKMLDVYGTGLGLYIVKQIVDDYGGRIWFESEINKGTTFYVTIPESGMTKMRGARPIIS